MNNIGETLASLLRNAQGIIGHAYRVGIRGDEFQRQNGDQYIYSSKNNPSYATNDSGNIIPISPLDKTKEIQFPRINQVQAQEPTLDQLPKSPWDEGFIGPQRPYRNPNWDNWKNKNPKAFEELLSGTALASKERGIPQDLLMDIAGIESSGGQFMNQLSGGPGKGPYQFENPELGYDPYSATSSASLAGKRIKNKQLSNWGYDENQQMREEGRNWGSVDNPNNINGRLTDIYTLDELNRYLTQRYQLPQ